MRFNYLLILLVLTVFSNTEAKAFTAKEEMCFVENKGQIKDEQHHIRRDVDFKVALGDGLNAFIGAGFVQYQFYKASGPNEYSTYKMVYTLQHAKRHIPAQKEGALNTITRYYAGNKLEELSAYRKVYYRNIYEGIDWVLYIKEGADGKNHLEYDFIVHEGANLNDIQFVCKGASDMQLQTGGSICYANPLGAIEEQKPMAYELESGKPVAARFYVQQNKGSFSCEDYKGTLVIDPTLDWSSYYGGTGDDIANSICTDAQYNIYVCGKSNSLSNIATVGSFQATIAGGYDAFIACFNSGGVRQWASYLGGAGDDVANSIVYNGAGAIYIAGSTSSSVGVSTVGSHQNSYGGGTDAFLAKFNTAGARLWSTYYGGSNEDQATAVACKGSVVYLAGFTKSTTQIVYNTSYQDTLSGGYDGFIARFTPTGNVLWGTYYGGTNDDEILGLSCDSNQRLYATGYSFSNGMASNASYQDTLAGVSDALLLCFDSSGTRAWASYYGGSNADAANAIYCDTAMNIYVGGYTYSSMGIASSGVYQTTLGGNSDAFIAQFNTAGAMQWGTYYGGYSNDACNSIYSNGAGKVYVCGTTASSSGIAISGNYQNTYGGGTADAMLAVFSNTGQRTWASYFGGSNADVAKGICIDAAQNMFMCGATSSNNQVYTANAYQYTYGGGAEDGFITKFKVDTLVAMSMPFYDTIKCAGSSFLYSYQTVATFMPTNVFTAQLSDSNGSFINAVHIGAVSATVAGNIYCTIPANAFAGNHYKLRIFSSAPADTSVDDSPYIHIKALPYHSVHCNSPLCSGDTLRFRDSSVNALSYSWHGPNGMTAFLVNPYMLNVVPIDSGWYTVTDSFSNGCTITDSLFVQIANRPLQPNITCNNPACLNDTLHLIATDSTAGVSFIWLGPNGFNSALANNMRTAIGYADSGWYIVSAQWQWCTSKPDTVDVHIDTFSSMSVLLQPQIMPIPVGIADTLRAIVSHCAYPIYTWYVNGTIVAGADSSYYVAQLNLNDSVKVSVHCAAHCLLNDTAVSSLLGPLGLLNEHQAGIVHVYPNPAQNVLHVVGEPILTAIICNMQGTIVLSNTLHSGTIDISGLLPGTYWMRLYNKDMQLKYAGSFIKQP
jgi:hypothetical protein